MLKHRAPEAPDARDRARSLRDLEAEQASPEAARERRERDGAAVGSPPDLASSLRRLGIRQTLAEFSNDQCTNLAAALT